MDAISAASGSLAQYQALLEVSSQRLSEGYVTPEVVSAQELAQVQIEAQTNLLKEALATQTQILDLLV